MKKVLLVLGALALVLAIVAGAGAAAQTLIDGHQLEDGSVTGAKIQDRSLHFVDFTSSGESMIRQGWRLATGKDKVKETMLDPALDAKITAATQPPPDALAKGKTVAGEIADRVRVTTVSDVLWTGVTYRLPVTGTVTPHVLGLDQKSTERAGTYAAPTATPGNLCIYIGSAASNTGTYDVLPASTVGFRFTWQAQRTGLSGLDATYAVTAP